MLQPLWMWKSALTLMIFAFGASWPSALRRPPARATQSSARITSAALMASIASGTIAFGAGVPGGIGREAAADLEVADHLGIERLCERDTVIPAVGAA